MSVKMKHTLDRNRLSLLEDWQGNNIALACPVCLKVFVVSGFRIYRRQMSRLCWYGLPTPLPLAMVYELHPIGLHAVP